MSYTEITFFGKDGNPKNTEVVKNAFRGAMAIWQIMEGKYLPPYIPWGYERMTRTINPIAIKEIWELAKNDSVNEVDKIVLLSTFDWVIVFKKDIPSLLNAFHLFEGITSLQEQAMIIRKIFENEEIIAVGWNQTSVGQNNWENFRVDENDETMPYNVNTDDKHWNLFDELKK